VDEGSLVVVGEAEVAMSFKDKTIRAPVFVIEGSRRNLVGRREIRGLGLLLEVNRVSSGDVKEEFPKLFQGLGTMPVKYRIELREGARPFRLDVPRRVPAGLEEEVVGVG